MKGTEAARLGGMSVLTVRDVRRDGKEGDRAWMPAMGDSEHGPENKGIRVKHKANMSLESSRARLSPSAGTEVAET